MNAVQNFAFDEHLVRVVDREGEPWFVGKDICKVLDISKHHQALESLDGDERGTSIVGTPSGDQTMIVVSEAGVYRLVFRSRKPEAERFKRWLAHDVLPAIRRTGRYGPAAPVAEPEGERDLAHAPLSAKVGLLSVALKLRGRAAALALWDTMGLPALPAALPDSQPEDVLAHLLDAEAEVGGLSVRELLVRALAGDATAAGLLAACGLRAGDGVFYVANAHPFIRRLFRPTRWQRPHRFLRRLDGALEAKVMKFGSLTSRGVELPAFYADEATLH